MSEPVTADLLLAAYASGYFPMADSRHGAELHWYRPKWRGVLPLDAFHVPSSLRKFMKSSPYEVSVDRDFPATIRACADRRAKDRRESWINDTIIELYSQLAEHGHAHSVECRADGELVGGLYGVSIGGAFFGESMFSTRANASKVALVHLVERLRAAGYTLLDTQYVNDHLLQFGVREVSDQDYLLSLEKALNVSPNPSTRFRTASVIKS